VILFNPPRWAVGEGRRELTPVLCRFLLVAVATAVVVVLLALGNGVGEAAIVVPKPLRCPPLFGLLLCGTGAAIDTVAFEVVNELVVPVEGETVEVTVVVVSAIAMDLVTVAMAAVLLAILDEVVEDAVVFDDGVRAVATILVADEMTVVLASTEVSTVTVILNGTTAIMLGTNFDELFVEVPPT
jgi:hypothetical protein